ncbi:MAG: hypothetical protein V1898_01400 [Patescibacteria group bacterium]
MKEKIFNERNDKIMRGLAVLSAILGVFLLLSVSTLFYIIHEYAPQLLQLSS